MGTLWLLLSCTDGPVDDTGVPPQAEDCTSVGDEEGDVRVYDRPMDPHHLAEERSLALHQEVGRRLCADPSLVQAAQERVLTWQSTGALAPVYVAGWLAWLSLEPSVLAERLQDRGEFAVVLRSVSPFAGVLSPQERWRIHRSVRLGLATQ